MPNVVEVIVKVNGDAVSGALHDIEAKTAASAGKQKSIWDKLGENMKTGLGTALKGVGGVIGGSAGLGLASPLAAAGLAVTAFAAVAQPELSKVQAALSKTGTAGQKAWAQLTPGERQVGTQLKGLETAFHGVQAALQPVIDKTIALAAHLGKDLLPALAPLAKGGAQFIDGFLKPFDKLASSPFFAQFAAQMGKLAAQAGSVLGPALVQILRIFMQLFMQLSGPGMQILRALVTVFLQLLQALVPVAVPIAKLIGYLVTMLTRTHLLIPVIYALAAAWVFLSGASGILAVVVAIALVIEAIRFFQQHWRQVWEVVKRVIDDAINFIKAHWQLIVAILTGPVGIAVMWIISHWHQITAFFARIPGDIASALSSLFSILTAPFRAAWSYISGFVSAVTSAISSIGHIAGGIAGALGFAHGGVVGAASGGPRSGMVMVGEHGRELVKLPAGSTVMSNPDTERAMGGGRGGDGHLSIDLVLRAEDMRELLRKHIRVRYGGNVDVALGA